MPILQIYFWEQNPHRALQYAKDVAGNKQKNNGKIKNKTGIDFFSEDVYSWEIRELFTFKITEEDGYSFEETFESLEKAEDVFPKSEGYIIEQIN